MLNSFERTTVGNKCKILFSRQITERIHVLMHLGKEDMVFSGSSHTEINH